MSLPTTPRLLVDTFREGLLARLGHDLRIEAERFEVRATGGSLTAKVDLTSLHVIGSVSKGKLDTSAPAPGDRAEIEQRIQREILGTARNPFADLTATVRAEGSSFVVAGTLVLCGRAQPIHARATRDASALEASVELAPSRYGIEPFRAFGGALRIADRVIVHIHLPLAAALPGADLAALTASWQRA